MGGDRADDPESAGLPAPHREERALIDRYDAKDVDGLVALMLEGGSTENVGNSYHIGVDAEEGVRDFLYHVVHGHEEWPKEIQWESARMQRIEFEGEPILLYLVTRRGDREKLMTAMRFEEGGGRIARIRSYGFCPDTIRALGEALHLPVFTGLYRAPDASWR